MPDDIVVTENFRAWVQQCAGAKHKPVMPESVALFALSVARKCFGMTFYHLPQYKDDIISDGLLRIVQYAHTRNDPTGSIFNYFFTICRRAAYARMKEEHKIDYAQVMFCDDRSEQATRIRERFASDELARKSEPWYVERIEKRRIRREAKQAKRIEKQNRPCPLRDAKKARAEAIAQNLNHYTGSPCGTCGRTKRFVSNNCCIGCNSERYMKKKLN